MLLQASAVLGNDAQKPLGNNGDSHDNADGVITDVAREQIPPQTKQPGTSQVANGLLLEDQ